MMHKIRTRKQAFLIKIQIQMNIFIFKATNHSCVEAEDSTDFSFFTNLLTSQLFSFSSLIKMMEQSKKCRLAE